MNVLITGGYGCIGSWIARNLVGRGECVYIFDLREDLKRMRQVMDESEWSQVRFVKGDVTDLAGFRDALEKYEISHVVHLAGLQVPVCRANPILGAQVNVVGTLVVFEGIRALADQVKRTVYASSAAVFGQPDDYDEGSLTDDVPLRPSTHYGVFKCCNEGNARIYFQDHGISSVGLRPWTVYGVARDFGMTSEPTKAIKSVALGRSFRISYGGFQDYQFTDDVANAFIRCLEVPFEGAKVYNLRGAVVDLKQFHEDLIAVAPEAARLVSHGDKQLPIAYDLSDDQFQKDLGPFAITPLREGVRQTLDRFRLLQREGRLDTSDL
jgi:nucleoside-diphosphate-sugar epimerase